jgi:hypothetical protein
MISAVQGSEMPLNELQSESAIVQFSAIQTHELFRHEWSSEGARHSTAE